MPSSNSVRLGLELEVLIRTAAHRIRASRRTVALTGAGLSVESGIPPFRRGLAGGASLWERYDPMEYGTIDAFVRDPGRVWLMLRELAYTLGAASPNEGHRALARLEWEGLLARVITQNVDGLHQKAGSREVLEFHGNWRTLSCLGCARKVPSETVPLLRLPPRCPCGGVLKPDVTLFGEIIPAALIDAAYEEARTCDVLLVIGTSAEVAPAAWIPSMARDRGACLIEINLEQTPLTASMVDVSLRGPAAVILPRLAEEAGLRAAN
ncbi:MAG TPA: NAD-dependent deacylase [Candidatus Polarisedimenticolia bacterium]|nr:NAD-dependent deacylase [Candidatus Polarisedimenticolia bacterium]